MTSHIRCFKLIAALLVTGAVMLVTTSGMSAAANELESESKAALQKLYSESEDAKVIGQKAKAVLVFPQIIKAGLLVGGQTGNGTLFKGGKSIGHYNSSALSYGLQAGVQWYGYAMFLMDDAAVDYLDASDGWELGSGPSVVVWDQGAAASMSSTTLQEDAVVFIFGQEGLMAGLGIQGTKITEIQPEEGG
ncbi:MAG: lipid-binding SYLF domain-containing protein [Pseudomonadota bacterium]